LPFIGTAIRFSYISTGTYIDEMFTVVTTGTVEILGISDSTVLVLLDVAIDVCTEEFTGLALIVIEVLGNTEYTLDDTGIDILLLVAFCVKRGDIVDEEKTNDEV